MPIPETPRVQYQKNPLEEVVCQLRFPSILKIGSEAPAGFQESVRREYPRFSEKNESTFTLPVGPGIPQDIARMIPAVTSYDFASTDGMWRVTLSRDFLALTCSEYTRWEDFRTRLSVALDAFVGEYEPAFFGRIGLRYRNVITRSELGLEGVEWAELLEPHALGELATPIAREVDGLARESMLRLERFGGKTRVLLATLREVGQPTDSFLVDCDFFTDQETEATNAIEALNYFNKQSGNLFRWYIRPRLHEAMDPRPL